MCVTKYYALESPYNKIHNYYLFKFNPTDSPFSSLLFSVKHVIKNVFRCPLGMYFTVFFFHSVQRQVQVYAHKTCTFL
jgi:hypothetical protein